MIFVLSLFSFMGYKACMRYSSITIPDQTVLSPFDTFDKLLSFCLFYENGEEWARHVFEKMPETNYVISDSGKYGKMSEITKRTIEGQL